jgi:hypothetical protein
MENTTQKKGLGQDIGSKKDKIEYNIKSELERYKGLKEQKVLDKDFFKLLEKPSVPHLHEKKVGKWEIRIDTILPMKEMTIVSARNWLMMGYKQLKCSFIEPRLVYKLLEEGKVRMSDTPQEMFLQYEAYKEAHGKVLIGGLGLGMSPSLFANKENVSKVVVVEIDKDVIKLCKPKNKKIRVIHEDIWKFLEKTEEKFDYIYIDIHYSTSCMEYIHTILPMRKLLEKRFSNIPASFWGEEEMKAQYDENFDTSKYIL